jgi:hypothetical protein
MYQKMTRKKTINLAKKKCEKFHLEYVEHKNSHRSDFSADVTCKHPKSNIYYFYDDFDEKWRKTDMN